jgi:hypothetical protein
MKFATWMVVLAIAGSTAWAQQSPTGSWPSAGRFATGSGFWQGGSATDGTHLYMLGGGPDPFWARRYDPATNGWTTIAGMPQGNVNFRAVYCQGSVYTIANGWQGAGWIYRYEIAQNQWSGPVANLSDNRFQVAAAVLGSKIYIAGGSGSSVGWTTDCEVYDVETGILSPMPPMPEPLGLAVGIGMESFGKAYFIGGQGNNGFESSCFELDPAADGGQGAWAVRTPINRNGQEQPAFYAGGFTLKNRIYITGGSSNFNQFAPFTLEYSPSQDLWVERASMTLGRWGHAAEAIGGRGYVYGGVNNQRNDLREEFVPPDFGAPPTLPPFASQIGAQTESSQQGGWTNNAIRFEADVKDPDAGQRVRLEVQVRAAGSESWGPVLSSGNVPQGVVGINFAIPAGGPHDWRWRVADDFDNYSPSADGVPQWVEAFGNKESPDFISDQLAPAVPIAVSPSNTDVTVFNAAGGSVTLHWVESIDNGPQDSRASRPSCRRRRGRARWRRRCRWRGRRSSGGCGRRTSGAT